MTILGDKARPGLEIAEVATIANKSLIDEALGDDDMRHRGQDRDIGSRLEREMMIGFDMRAPDQIDASRVDDDEAGAGAQPLLQTRGEDRMGVGRIGADDHHDVRLFDRLEILRARGRAVGLRKTEACRRMADAGASVDIVVAEAGAHHFLNQKDLFVGAARRGNRADQVAAVFLLDALELARRIGDRFFP